MQAIPDRRCLVFARLLEECAGWRVDAGRQEQDGPVQRVGVQLLVRATFAADPTLETVLNNAQIYSGSPLPGTSGYPLNAFNATGAYLTDNIPGYHFDINVMMAGGSDACPIDHFGHFKSAAVYPASPAWGRGAGGSGRRKRVVIVE